MMIIIIYQNYYHLLFLLLFIIILNQYLELPSLQWKLDIKKKRSDK